MNVRDRALISISGHELMVQVTDDGSRTLIDPNTGVAYHSASGAAAETENVYLANSGVRDLMEHPRSLDDSECVPVREKCISVLEIGLGTGMAMLMTLDVALRTGAGIRYAAIERDLLAADLLAQLQLDRHVTHPKLVEQFLGWRRSLSRPVPKAKLTWQVDSNRQVAIFHMNAEAWVGDPKQTETYDAIYFDPFAPETNPELWTPSFLKRMYKLLKPSRRLVTYCVSRAVRSAMEDARFSVQRVPGPKGGKREVLVATKL
jgi:tRNA U34 5-methylaminomethyl-2-thiouridine-forming methyltransferase MnmC